MKQILLLSFIAFISINAFAQNTGIGTTSPGQKLHVNGKLKIADDATTPTSGTIRWNTTTSDFEGFNGEQWLSLTAGSTSTMGTGDDIGKLKDYTVEGSPTPTTEDRMGDAVDISGDWAVVGCRAEGVSGAAHVFKRNGTDWAHSQKLLPSSASVGASFGLSVAIDGNYLIVGAAYDSAGIALLHGSAFIYFYNGSTWIEQQKILNGSANDDEWFGSSVDISGDWVIVGAPQVDVFSDLDKGRAYAFKRSGVTWTGNGVFTGPGSDPGDYFGNSVAIDGNYVVIGAPFSKTGGVTLGSAHTYFFNGTSWTTQTKLLSSNGVSGDLFGFSVAISGNLTVVGSREHTGEFTNSGAAYIFSRSGSSWTQQAYLIAPDGNANAGFGTSVAISGTICIIGDPGHYRKNACGTNVTSNEGQAYVFKKIGTIWEEYLIMKLPRGKSGDNFGTAVTLDGLYVAASAPTADVNGIENSGKVIFGKLE